jgi:hypothetical protein
MFLYTILVAVHCFTNISRSRRTLLGVLDHRQLNFGPGVPVLNPPLVSVNLALSNQNPVFPQYLQIYYKKCECGGDFNSLTTYIYHLLNVKTLHFSYKVYLWTSYDFFFRINNNYFLEHLLNALCN